jgi:DNA-binding LacI/PurR family transcriptional regulator
VKTAGGVLTVQRAQLTRKGVDAVADAWCEATEPPDAICAFNDDFAIALLSAFATRGVNVPGDVAVIGVDDVPLASACTPSLTTVTCDMARWGEAVAGLVQSALAGSSDVVPLPLLDTRVVVRESA